MLRGVAATGACLASSIKGVAAPARAPGAAKGDCVTSYDGAAVSTAAGARSATAAGAMAPAANEDSITPAVATAGAGPPSSSSSPLLAAGGWPVPPPPPCFREPGHDRDCTRPSRGGRCTMPSHDAAAAAASCRRSRNQRLASRRGHNRCCAALCGHSYGPNRQLLRRNLLRCMIGPAAGGGAPHRNGLAGLLAGHHCGSDCPRAGIRGSELFTRGASNGSLPTHRVQAVAEAHA